MVLKQEGRDPYFGGPLIEARKNRVVVLEELDFIWDEPDLKILVRQWNAGVSVEESAEYFGRDPDEILLAIIHLARNYKISRRKGGLKGDGNEGS